MSATATVPQLMYQGQPMEMDHLGLMDDATRLLADRDALHRELQERGYVYLPGYLGRQRVVEARKQFISRFQEAGALDPDRDPMDGVVRRPARSVHFIGGRLDRMFPEWRKIHDVLYEGPMMDFFRFLLDGPVRHYDYTWIRQNAPGKGTMVHSDIVYMGRGTHRLYTAWTPMGDNDFSLGGLILLEGSHHHQGLARQYWRADVDAFCENKPDKRDMWQRGHGGWFGGHVNRLRQSLGFDRWVTQDYRMGDVVIFNCYIVHGSSDNTSNRVRLSTDTRYQRADEPIDERWIGEDPVGHGPGGKRGMIC